ncbi:MAG TPA: MoxR family ATPase, partial [Chlamydiales bacterium]|nr:MoxR family ATPase [Chlamydiales bacterium]
IKEANAKLATLRSAIFQVIVGQERLVDRLIIALLCQGHVLLEGVPGIAKTLAANTLSHALALDCKRIQFTPDLLPSDLIGTLVFNPKDATFFVQKGPIFTNIVVADEINRAPPKVQSALLEVMQEGQVTIGRESLQIENPFLVIATQNPIEHEGTYPLPEAETDRFMMKVKVDYPKLAEEKEIVRRMCHFERPKMPQAVLGKEEIVLFRKLLDAIYIDEKVLSYIINIVFATRYPKEAKLDIGPLLDWGASPRASIYLVQASKAHALISGREYVTPFDVKQVAYDVLRHRLILSYEAEAQELKPEDILDQIFEKIAVP